MNALKHFKNAILRHFKVQSVVPGEHGSLWACVEDITTGMTLGDSSRSLMGGGYVTMTEDHEHVKVLGGRRSLMVNGSSVHSSLVTYRVVEERGISIKQYLKEIGHGILQPQVEHGSETRSECHPISNRNDIAVGNRLHSAAIGSSLAPVQFRLERDTNTGLLLPGLDRDGNSVEITSEDEEALSETFLVHFGVTNYEHVPAPSKGTCGR